MLEFLVDLHGRMRVVDFATASVNGSSACEAGMNEADLKREFLWAFCARGSNLHPGLCVGSCRKAHLASSRPPHALRATPQIPRCPITYRVLCAMLAAPLCPSE